MEWNELTGKIATVVGKYKYVILVLVVGIILMCLPFGEKSEQTQQSQQSAQTEKEDLAQQLEGLLCQLQGAGKVKVMLSLATGEQIIYQYDENIQTGTESGTVRKDTVVITDADRNEQAVITQTIPPVYLGAVILCQGADQAAVKLAVVEAVSKATGLGADRICVLKMK